jgi:uncharacterized membrane protein YjjP (DUF1212 family)
MKTEELTDIAVRAGEILLQSGAEIYRVEDTIVRILASGSLECECFVLLTGIFLSVSRGNDGKLTLIKRVKDHSFDLSRIEKVNSLSRELMNRKFSYCEAAAILDSIHNTKPYAFILRLAAAGAATLVYTMLIKGSPIEALAASVIGMTIYSFRTYVARIGTFPFWETVFTSMLASFMSLMAASGIPGVSVYKTLIGGIVILLPGMAITNGIKDALHGDVVSSLYRLTEALFGVTAVGIGVAIVLTLGLGRS